MRRALHRLLGTISCVDLVRTWARQLAATSLTVLGIPLAVVGALVVLTLAGGFGSLGSLGQIFAGPTTAKSARAAAPAAAVLSRSAIAPTQATTARASANASGGTAGAAAPVPRPARSRSAPVAPEPASTAARPVLAGSRPITPSTAVAARAPVPAPHPTIVGRVLGVATTVTTKLPAPVGPAATQAVQSVGSAVPHLP
jgi:hypothetical protein